MTTSMAFRILELADSIPGASSATARKCEYEAQNAIVALHADWLRNSARADRLVRRRAAQPHGQGLRGSRQHSTTRAQQPPPPQSTALRIVPDRHPDPRLPAGTLRRGRRHRAPGAGRTPAIDPEGRGRARTGRAYRQPGKEHRAARGHPQILEFDGSHLRVDPPRQGRPGPRLPAQLCGPASRRRPGRRRACRRSQRAPDPGTPATDPAHPGRSQIGPAADRRPSAALRRRRGVLQCHPHTFAGGRRRRSPRRDRTQRRRNAQALADALPKPRRTSAAVSPANSTIRSGRCSPP